MALLSLQDFAGAIDQQFDLEMGAATIAMTLVEAKPFPTPPFPGKLRESFAVMFRSASQVVLPQRIYRLSNATMGANDIFLVPVARDAQGVIYQAVFS